MGREIMLNRIDFLNDGTAIVRDNDFVLCGRTEFTNSLANLFYVASMKDDDRDIYYLILKEETEENKDKDFNDFHRIKTIHIKSECKYCEEKELDIDYAFEDRKLIQSIANESMHEDELIMNAMQEDLEDARIARQHSQSLEIFGEFSHLIRDLYDEINDFDAKADRFIEEIIRIEQDIKYSKYDPNIKESFVLIELSE